MKEVTSLEAARQQRLDDQSRQEYIQRIGARITRELPQTILEAKTLEPADASTVIMMLDSAMRMAQDYIRKCKQAAGPR